MKIEATTAEVLDVCHHNRIASHHNRRQHVFNGPINKSCQCSTEDNEEGIITQQPLWQLYKTSHSRDRALSSKGLYLPFLPEDRSLEAEMQEV